MTQNQGFPQINSPFTDPDSGKITQAWFKLLLSLWTRTGSAEGTTGPYDPTNVSISGGSINGTSIGANSPSTGIFTNLRATVVLSAANFSGSSIGSNTGDQTIVLSSDVSGTGRTAITTTIDAIKGTTVAGTTGTGNVAFSNGPTFTGTVVISSLIVSNNITLSGASKTLVLKQGVNGKTGTVVLSGTTAATVLNSSITSNSNIFFTLKTIGGTVGSYPTIKTITPTTGFTVNGTVGDISTYNYAILESA